MIPHSSAGVQSGGHPLRIYDNGPKRVEASQSVNTADFRSEKQRMPGLLPPPNTSQAGVIDLTPIASDARETEPPAKRLKLDISAGPLLNDASSTSATGGESRLTSGIANQKPSLLSLRGRPVWSFQAMISEANNGAEAIEDDPISTPQGTRPTSPPPLPHLPWKGHPPDDPGDIALKAPEGGAVKKVQTTPFRVEIPSVAPVLKGDRVADFSPWTGNHPEDILNEQSVKQGHYDRTQVSQNESNTARPSLYAQLKHRSGLQTLSSVFVAALEKRQNHITVTAPSSFKPPPRVTLTDNKREAWLRDLANPSVPLRRLSRTIPHGIRGKALLDQCLSKWIPVTRAVWLAKCVGANEIRAFKRKGTSGSLAIGLEAKWVREWTSGVQQFLDGVIGTRGPADWKRKMTYAVSLAARLFYDRLLDHDQYFGWFLSSMESASLNMIPIWLLLLGIYWDSILRYRKRGRRLAEVLIEKLRQITELRRPALLQPLIDRLLSFIRKLVLEHTSSVVLPNTWEAYKDVVRSSLRINDNTDKTVFNCLAERNFRVQMPKAPPRSPHQSAQLQIIQLLDSVQSLHDIPFTSTSCLDILEDRAALVAKVLEWSATRFRSGLHRVYTAARLLRKWKMSGVDIDSYIIAYLSTIQGTVQLDMENIYHVISELVRSRTFSISRYLQRLMAKGVVRKYLSDNDKIVFGDVCILIQLPMSRLPDHICNLRHSLLARAGVSMSEEDSNINRLKTSISQRLPSIFPRMLGNITVSMVPHPNLPWAVKSEVSMWIRQGVAKHLRNPTRKILEGPLSIDSKVSALTPQEFHCVRDILEGFGDLSVLADVLKQATNCEDNVVLASVSDTVNYHLEALSVIGATSDLFRGLISSYARLKRSGALNLDFVFSLTELGLRLPEESSTVALLRQDLARIENKSALTAPSPLSDHVPSTTFGDPDASFQDKLDQLLSCGNGIDESTMSTIFNSLTRVLGFGNGRTNLSANDSCRYLAYLRLSNPKYFDAMIVRYVCGLLRSSSRPMMSQILPPLIGVGCVTIYSFVLLVKKLSTPEKATAVIPDMTSLRLDLLELLLPQEETSMDLVVYRFRLAQQEFLAKYPEDTLNIISDAIPLLSLAPQQASRGSRCAGLTVCTAALLRAMLARNSSLVAKYCTQKLTCHSSFTAVLEQAVDDLLGLDSHDRSEPSSQAARVILINNDFSLPFCQMKLQLLFNAKPTNEVKNTIADVMFKAAVADSRDERSHWAGLVNLMSQDAARQIRERAESDFFSIPLFDDTLEKPLGSTEAVSTGSIESARLHLTIIEKLAYSIPEAGVQSVAPLLVERLDLLLQKLIAVQTNPTGGAESRNGSSAGPAIMPRSNIDHSLAFWFSALLRMTVLHRTAFVAPASLGPKGSSVQEQTRLLVSIFCIALAGLPDNILRLFPTANDFPHAIQPDNTRPCPGILLQTHVLDVAASLIDLFSDEARHQCARFLKEKCPLFLQFQNDRRFLYLLGPMVDTTTLNPQMPASVSSPAASGSTPTPTPSANIGGTPNQSQQIMYSTGVLPGLPENTNLCADHLRIQHRGRVIGPYPVRPWELLEDAAPLVGVNDTAVSLKLFDIRRVRV
ncbi:hypothetical protein BJX70DRAFT_409135 [Aspergillus crustosus]